MRSASGVLRGADWSGPLRLALALEPADTVTWMAHHTRLLKNDTYCRAGLLDLQHQPCFLKFYLAKSPWQKLGFRLGYGRGIDSFDAASQLLHSGLPVPAPRSCVLVPEGMLLLTEGIADSRDLRALWLAQPGADHAAQFMQCAGATLAALHRAGFAHGDCKWSNLLWNGEHVYLVDLEAVRRVREVAGTDFPPGSRQLRDLARFTVDAEELDVSREQYGVFLQHYCAGMHSARELLVSRIRSAVQPIRRRHLKKYGKAYRSLV